MTDSASTKDIIRMVSSGAATSRADLVRELGLAASTVSLRVQELVAAGLLTESGEGASRGGRRPRLLRVRQRDDVCVAADLGSHHARIGAVGHDGTVRDVDDHHHDLTAGPEQAVEWLVEHLGAGGGGGPGPRPPPPGAARGRPARPPSRSPRRAGGRAPP
ncbi:winged helix-turn-helix domain-containing protein, partial [Streptomyces sp. 8L]|uniref:winged helix-turn-helix domain-containing protein n=1 Tax=Streptomyces sp. 8L TaxID=2877242 RepID=UPI001CD1DF31